MSKLVLTRYEIKTEYNIPEPITIAQASDIHERHNEDTAAMLAEIKPDIIVVTGDTYERYDNRPQYDFERKPVKKLIINAIHYMNRFLIVLAGRNNNPKTANSDSFLKTASEIAPLYVSLGNHEQKLLGRDYRFLAETGIRLLDNEYQKVSVNGFELLIGGMSSWEYEDFFERFKTAKGFKLLLCHHPEQFEKIIKDTDIPLTLSGHTHGGQIRIGKKGAGFFVPGQGIFGKYAHGSFFGGRLIVSAGCSNTVAFPRINNPRELVVITLKGKNDGEV